MISYFMLLQKKYGYDDKVMTALKKIIPMMISYYGIKYQDIILEAILKTEIICCDASCTVNMVEKKLKGFVTSIKDDSSSYVTVLDIKFDPIVNNYIIDDVNNYVVISHLYNLDSPKGIAILTKELCHVVKNYFKGFNLKDDLIIKKVGMREEVFRLSKKEDIKGVMVKSSNKGLEEGLTLFDVESITSSILNDKYVEFSYDVVKDLAYFLHKIYSFEDIFQSEILKSSYLEEEIAKFGLWETFNSLLDYSMSLEDMINDVNCSKKEKETLLNSKEKIKLKILEVLSFLTMARKKEEVK